MRTNIMLALSVLLLMSTCFADGWESTYGGSDDDCGMFVTNAADGGYVVAGYTDGYGAESNDVYLLKVNADGAYMWRTVLGSSGADEAYSIAPTSDGGFIVTGTNNGDVWLLRLDSGGDTLWTNTYGSYCGNSVKQTTDGGYIIAGQSSSSYGDFRLIKTSSIGTESWARTYGGSSYEHAYSVAQTSDGGYIIVGYTHSFGAGGYDAWLIKTDSEGWEEWTQTFGGSNTDYGYCVKQTSDGGYIIAGYTSSFGAGSYDAWLIKTDPLGNEVWSQTYGGSSNDKSHSVVQLDDGGYMLVGFTQSFGAGSYDLWLIRTDSIGDTLFTRTFGGTGYDYGECIERTLDGNFIIAGYTNSDVAGYDVYLIKTDSLGYTEEPADNHAPVFTSCPDDTTIEIGEVLVVDVLAEDPDGHEVFYGLCDPPHGAIIESTTITFSPSSGGSFHIIITACDPWACDTCDFYVTVPDAVSEKISKPNVFYLDVQPNPFNSSCAITAPSGAEIEIYDIRGNVVGATRWVAQEKGDASHHPYIWQPDESISSGVYLIRATAGDKTITKRAILMK